MAMTLGGIALGLPIRWPFFWPPGCCCSLRCGLPGYRRGVRCAWIRWWSCARN